MGDRLGEAVIGVAIVGAGVVRAGAAGANRSHWHRKVGVRTTQFCDLMSNTPWLGQAIGPNVFVPMEQWMACLQSGVAGMSPVIPAGHATSSFPASSSCLDRETFQKSSPPPPRSAFPFTSISSVGPAVGSSNDVLACAGSGRRTDGRLVGCGRDVGFRVGPAVGTGVGPPDGLPVGAPDGGADGPALGSSVGAEDGMGDGRAVGAADAVGLAEGRADGAVVGLSVGLSVAAPHSTPHEHGQ